MILPQTSNTVLVLMVLSLFFLGAWASMFKAAGKWRFELFYFDFAFGMILAAIICAFTVGDLGYDGFNFLDDLQHAGKRQWLFALLAGIIFNLGNMLLMGAISVAGMALAFPAALGVALLLGLLLGAGARPGGNETMTLMGSLLILTSVIVSAIAYRIIKILQHEQLARAGVTKSTRRPNPIKGIVLMIVSGLLMGSIGGLVTKARADEVGLGPYSFAAIFAIGVFGSSFIFNIFLMNLPIDGEPLEFSAYFKSSRKQHILGIIGGILWFLGTQAALVAASVPENIQPSALIRYLLLQGAPIVAALLGIFVWKELKAGDMRVTILAVLMLALFACGLAMIGLSPQHATQS